MKKSKSIYVIINPIAGVRPKDEIPNLVHQTFPSDEYDVTIWHTLYAGHASEIARKAVDEHIDIVVAIGGDGTINETARSLVGTSVQFGLVPMGSGNGLARHIQIPLECQRALEVIRDGHVDAIDYGVINGHIFFCTAGVGFDAEVSQMFAHMKERGGLSYVRSTLNLLRDYKPSTYVIHTDDGRIRERAFLIAIGNASQWGNNAMITPRASMQDGLMDVTLLKPFPMIEVPQLTMQLFAGTLDSNPHTVTFRTAHMRIIMPKAKVVHVDGEPIEMDGILDIQTYKSGLQVLTPSAPMHGLLEPFQYAFSEIQYNIQANLRNAVAPFSDLKKVVEEPLHDWYKNLPFGKKDEHKDNN